jgi:hypothetical protein
MIPTEVMHVPLPADDQNFLNSNVFGRLRRRGLIPTEGYMPTLTDIHLFEAAVFEMFQKSDNNKVGGIGKMLAAVGEKNTHSDPVKEIIAVKQALMEGETYEDTALNIFSWMCEI